MAETPESTIEAFLAAVAAKQPTPGGGAVAAICGALAAAIGEMVLNYSIGRKATPHLDPQLQPHLLSLTRARGMLLQLMVEDQEAFAAFTAAKKLPDDSAEKSKAVTDAQAACIAVPQAITATAVAILSVADAVVEISNRWLLSDLAVCCELAMAAARSGIHNVHANLGSVDADAARKLEGDCAAELRRAIELVQKTMPRIAATMKQA